jgi:hypothetical protein
MMLLVDFALNQKLSRVTFYPIYVDHFDGLSPRSTAESMGEHRIKWGSKNILDLNYAFDLSI